MCRLVHRLRSNDSGVAGVPIKDTSNSQARIRMFIANELYVFVAKSHISAHLAERSMFKSTG